jgi:hypothetical protein
MVFDRSETCGLQRNSQDDAIVTPEKDIGDLFRGASNRLNAKPPPIQGLTRIRDFNPCIASVRVIELGIKMWCRSIEFNTTS